MTAASPNPLAAALAGGRFTYVVELVASALTREAKLLDVAARLARVPEVVAGSVTSYAGGALGHDPLRVGTAARARGLTPNIHLTCASQDRRGLRKTLEDLAALGLHNVFALTGDYPPARPDRTEPPAAVFDLDSVQLVRLIDQLRRAGMPFHVAVAVSPFKWTEADCVYQYLKLEKKVAAGADCAITQVGWDARKFAELKRWMDERGRSVPLLGNVYVLGPRAAERMAKGQPPGCWVSPALLERVRAREPGARRRRCARGWSARPGRSPCCGGWATPAPTSGALTMPSTCSGSSGGPTRWRRAGKNARRSSTSDATGSTPTPTSPGAVAPMRYARCRPPPGRYRPRDRR